MKSRFKPNRGNHLICKSSVKSESFGRDSFLSNSLIAFSLIIALLASAGCSSTDNIVVSDPGSLKANGALTYLPVSTGYIATFSVTDQNGASIGSEIYVGRGATTVSGLPGVRWSVANPTDSNKSESGAVYWDDNAIYHLQDGSQVAEIILQEPFVVGATWNRWVSLPIDPDTITISNDNQTANESNFTDIDTTSGAISLSSFPTKGQSTFYVASTDDAIQVNGETLNGCLQIVNTGAASTVNRYWYCPGVGLVKYALECNFGSTTGKVNGEKVS